jgi:choline kinase
VIALILNSGVGHRMGDLTKTKPKCMTSIGGGYTVLSRQLIQLERAGIRDVVLTTGPFAEALRAYVESLRLNLAVRYAHSPDYATTNYIVSMSVAAPLLRAEEVFLCHGDLVMEDSVLTDLLKSPVSAMAVDSALPLPEKDFKAKLRDGRVVAVGVNLFGDDCVACQPAYRWLAEDFARWLAAIETFVQNGQTNVYAENAFNAADGAIPLFPLELHGRLCAEIDNPDDLAAIGARFRQTLAGQTGEHCAPRG